jgi:hypothetical protein
MRSGVLKILAVSFALASSVPDLSADSFRCGLKLIKTGDSTSELLRVCGKPIYKDRGVARIKVNGVIKEAKVQRWHYKKSSRRLEHVVLIFRGQVHGIETGSR